MKRHLDYSHLAPAHTMVRVLQPQREGVREQMARAWGVDAEEIAERLSSRRNIRMVSAIRKSRSGYGNH